jgi:hypothetical protein
VRVLQYLKALKVTPNARKFALQFIARQIPEATLAHQARVITFTLSPDKKHVRANGRAAWSLPIAATRTEAQEGNTYKVLRATGSDAGALPLNLLSARILKAPEAGESVKSTGGSS